MIHKITKVRGADFCDDQFPIISTVGRGPKGEKGEQGEQGEQGETLKFADPIEWDNQNAYETLTVVLYQGDSYISKQAVPAGIDISDEGYWTHVGDFNAQVEVCRQETAQALQAAESAQDDIDMLLPKSAFATDNTVKDYIDAVDEKIDNYIPQDSTSEMHYLFRLSATSLEEPLNENVPQGMCILPNDIGMFALAPSSTSSYDTARLFKVDMNTKKVVSYADAPFGHCNSMCYDIQKNLLYVMPNQMAGTNTSSLLICIPDNLSIQRSIDMPIQGRIMYDKATDKVYLANMDYIYEIDTDDDYSATRIGTIDRSNVSHSLVPENGYLGNGMTIYNGIIYYTGGSNGQNLLMQISLSGEVLKVSQIPYSCYLYQVKEFQDCDITDDGILVVYSVGYIASRVFGVVGGISINGISRFPVTDVFTTNAPISLNRNYDANGIGANYNIPITCLGNSGNPMLTPIEAQWAAMSHVQTPHCFIQLTGFIKASELNENSPLYLRCISATDSGLILDKALTLTKLYIDTYGNGSGHAFIKKTVDSTGFLLNAYHIALRDVTVEFEAGVTSAHIFGVRGILNIGTNCRLVEVESTGALSQITQSGGLISCESGTANAYSRFLAIDSTPPVIVASLGQ